MAENYTTINTNDIDDFFRNFNLELGITGLLQLPVLFSVLLLMIFVYKTYRTTFQRLILYFVVIGLWFQFSCALWILLVYIQFGEERRVCIIEQFLSFSPLIAFYTYIAAITNFSLILVPCLMRGRPLSKRTSKWAECVCVALTAIISLAGTASIAVQICINHITTAHVALYRNTSDL